MGATTALSTTQATIAKPTHTTTRAGMKPAPSVHANMGKMRHYQGRVLAHRQNGHVLKA